MTRLGLVAMVLVAGCGDPLLCKSDVFVALQTGTITTDLDLAPGVQGDLHLKTSLDEGESVEVTILDVDGQVASKVSAPVDARGDATIRATFPPPRVTVRATAIGVCGEGADETTIEILAGSVCELAFDPLPATSTYYAPRGVFTASNDANSVLAGVQTQVRVATRAGWFVDLYIASSAGESVVANGPTTGGITSLVATLPDGNVTVRGVCHDATSSSQIPSRASSVFVDASAPSCDITSPVAGSTITPAFDLDHDRSNGVQLDVGIGGVGTGDLAGELYTLAVTGPNGGTTLIGGAFDSSSAGTASVTLAPPATPATFTFALTSHDHAGNVCTAVHDYTVVLDGCDLAIDPLAVVTVDADGDAANGAQLDLSVTVAPACLGRTVTSSCGFDSPTGVVPATGPVILRETVCATSPCEAVATCTVSVTTAAGVATAATATVQFDNAAPVVSVAVTSPALPCGSQVTPASDIDPMLDGVQVIAQVTASGIVTSKSIAQTNGNGTQRFDASANVELTVAPGLNTLVGSATDMDGNVGRSPSCTLTLSDLSVSFSTPAADGAVGRQDGTVSGTNLTFPLCGTVNKTGATVTVAIDGGPSQTATVTGTQWCRTITLAQSPPNHTIVASATVATSQGSSSLVLAVDLTVPAPLGDLAVVPESRASVIATWTAPTDNGGAVAGYLVKIATTPLTNANFDTTGTVVASGMPKSPGTRESLVIPGRAWSAMSWVGIATIDEAGNRSVAAIAGPFAPGVVTSGAIQSTDNPLGSLALGSAIAHGKYNNDELDDVAVAAPTENTGGLTSAGAVYVYFGTPTGLSATPGLVIQGALAQQRVGASLATVRWTSATRDDLVVGAPGADGGSGRVYVFVNATLGTGTRAVSTAERQISVNATANWFTGGNLATTMVAADLDGDGTLDLAIGAPKATVGRLAMLYGPLAGNVTISNTALTGTGVLAILSDPLTSPRQFTTYLHAVGKIGGASDTTDDMVVGYADDTTTPNDSIYVLRGGSRPGLGVSQRTITIGRDVRIDLVTPSTATEWGSQATTIADQNGDGARDLVIGAYQNLGKGQVFIISGKTLGVSGVAKTTDPAVVLSTISGTPGSKLGASIASRDASTIADLDGDGVEDLVVAGLSGGAPALFVWFAIPRGATTTASASYVIPGPSTFGFAGTSGSIAQARWLGDVDGDGLADLCWSAPLDNRGDGSYEVVQ